MRQATNGWDTLRTGLSSLIVLWLGAITLSAATPGTPAPSRTPVTPLWGIVVKEDAVVRSGAGTSYITGQLAKGSFVQIKKIFQGWYKIVPPKGSYSFISKAFVNARGDGHSGVINRNRAAVKAVNLKDKGNSYRTQVSLIKGTRVQIIDEYGSYYMVTPPKGAHVYVRASAVLPATKEQLRAAGLLRDKTASPPLQVKPVVTKPQRQSTGVQVQPSPTTKPQAKLAPIAPTPIVPTPPSPPPVAVSPPPPAPPVTPAPASNPVAKPVGELVMQAAETEPKSEPKIEPLPKAKVIMEPEVQLALTREPAPQPPGDLPSEPADQPVKKEVAAAQTEPMLLSVAEQRYRLISKLKLDQQPVDELIEAYRSINRTQLTPAEREKVDLRILILRRRAILADTLARITRSRIESEAVVLPVSAGHPKPTPAPDHIGYLLLSGVYDGVHQPRLYRLVDRTTGRTITYVRPSKVIDSSTVLGKVVRIQGTIALSEQLRRDVLTVDRLEVVESAQQQVVSVPTSN